MAAVTLPLFVVATAGAVEAPVVTVKTASGSARVETQHATLSVRFSPLGVTLRSLPSRRLARSAPSGFLFYERGGIPHAVLRATSATALADGVSLVVATDEGLSGTLTLRFLTSRSVEVTFDPPDPLTVEANGARFRSPRREAIYGLTERLRDSPALSPGVVDIPIDDIQPVEVGSLDRKGETVEMRVLPTFSACRVSEWP